MSLIDKSNLTKLVKDNEDVTVAGSTCSNETKLENNEVKCDTDVKTQPKNENLNKCSINNEENVHLVHFKNNLTAKKENTSHRRNSRNPN